jgi:hypothetical protein
VILPFDDRRRSSGVLSPSFDPSRRRKSLFMNWRGFRKAELFLFSRPVVKGSRLEADRSVCPVGSSIALIVSLRPRPSRLKPRSSRPTIQSMSPPESKVRVCYDVCSPLTFDRSIAVDTSRSPGPNLVVTHNGGWIYIRCNCFFLRSIFRLRPQ